MVRRPHTEPHDGPCTFDPLFGVEKVRQHDGDQGLAIFCKCGKWEYVSISSHAEKGKLRFWSENSTQPIAWAAVILLVVLLVVWGESIRNLAVYPIRLLILAAAFMGARAVYKYLDPAWDRCKAINKEPSINWRAFTAALLIFFATGIFLESLPTHQMANSFAHEAFDE